MKRLFLIAFVFQSGSLFSETWVLNDNGNWNTAANWSPSTVPNAVDAVANFTSSTISANRTITLDVSATVGTIAFDSNFNYLISQGGVNFLTLDVSAGSAQITVTATNGNGSHTLAVPITLNDDLSITQGSSGTFTISGAISGAHSVTKAGSGTLVLSGSNGFSGGLTLQAGTLNIHSDGALGMAGVGITMSGGTLQAGVDMINVARAISLSGAGTFDSQSNTFTLSNAITGAGSLTKTGSGTLILSGANMYMGGTTISAGTLQVSSDGKLGDAAGALTIGTATLQASGALSSARSISLTGAATVDTQANTVTLSGPISGASGSLTKAGSGTLILSDATNDYQGGTTISAGTLQISADSNMGDPAGSLAIGTATLQTTADISSARSISLTGAATIDPQLNSLTLSGNISGSGSLVKASAGTLTLLGNNNYSGGTTISAGTLEGNSNSLQGNISNSGTLIFNQTFTGTYSGVLSGAGALSKQGSGLLQLTGTSDGFTGATAVTAGNLNVNGSIKNSAVTVSAGATLSGNGTVGTTINNGTISPGNSTGTLTINGDLTLNPTSQVITEISPFAADLIRVTGMASLDGDLSIQPLSGFFYGISASYTILTASPVGGTFASFASTNSNFIPSVDYLSDSVQLTVQIREPFLDFPFSNSNTESVGNNFDALAIDGFILSNSDLVNILNSLAGQSFDIINNALDQMHPAQLSAFTELQAEAGSQLISLFHHKPLLLCGCWGRWHLWAEPFGNWIEVRSQDNQVGFNATTSGIAFGIDAELLDNWILGVGGAWSNTNLQWDLNRGHGDVEGGYGAIYTDYTTDNVYVGASFLAGVDTYDTARHIQFTTIDRHAVAHYDALDFIGQLSCAYFFGSPACHLYPYANVDYLFLSADPFTESEASGLNLSVRKNESSTLRAEGGMGLEVIDKNYDETICISPLIAIGYALNYPLKRDPYTANFEGEPISFQTKGWDLARQFLTLHFGLRLYYRCFTLSGEYIGDFSTEGGSPFTNQRGNFTIDVKW